MLDTHEEQGQLWASLTYATDLFDCTTIERLAGHWQALLEGIVSATTTHGVSELPMLSAAERAATLAAWNTAPATFTPSQPLHRLIEAQAARAPGAGAGLRRRTGRLCRAEPPGQPGRPCA